MKDMEGETRRPRMENEVLNEAAAFFALLNLANLSPFPPSNSKIDA